ncbi:tyrosine-type recombinase/integrase [Nocardia sp. CA-135398]|uniref:tyrosine-type recombinase/integrase n=1 Tax=Nocardia sp. CA-135398 TaxID=3239977 RepID=UPI003D9731F5
MTSCNECLAWGLTYAQGVCLACYNFAAARFRQVVGDCRACRRRVRLRNGYCRLCWCQARADRAVTADGPRAKVVLAPHLSKVSYHQLFLADTYRPQAQPRIVERRYGTKGRPPKQAPPIAGRPLLDGVQLVLFDDLARTYRPSSIDLRSVAAPDNPWLAWALHLAWTMAETHGFAPGLRRALNRNLIMLLATHADVDTVRVSDFHRLICRRGNSLIHVIDVLSAMGVLVDDRPKVFDTWLEAKTDDLAPAIADSVARWAHMLREGGPRRLPRHPSTATGYINFIRPALLNWSSRYSHLREVTRADVLAHLDTLRGEARSNAMAGLRSLFGWAKREALIFRNPCARIRLSKAPPRIWQSLSDNEIAAAVKAADTPPARLFVALAAIHAARPGQIRALHLDDVDLGNRRITISGGAHPLDPLTHQLLIDWLDHRRQRWPHTANPHLLISKESALRTGPVSAAFLQNLRGLPANLERLRIDRQLEEALACGGDPLHLAAVFGIDPSTAIRYATNARKLLDDPHAALPPESLPTQGSTPDNSGDPHLGSS